MRVLLVNQYYPPDVAATGQLLADVAGALIRAGHEVQMICSAGAYDGGAVKHATGAIENEECGEKRPVIHRVRATGFGRGTMLGRLLDYGSFYGLALVWAVRLGRVDVCVALTTPPFIGLIGLVLKALWGTKLVIWSMDLYPEVAVAYGVLKPGSLVHRLLRWLARRLYRRAWRIISLGEVMTQRLIEAGGAPDKIVTVHNWVPGETIQPQPYFDRAHPLRQAWGLNGEATAMVAGNLGGGHDLETVVRAMARLRERGSDPLRLLLVGRGQARATLERLATELELDNVDFHDPVPLERLNDLLALGQIQIVAQKPGTQGLIVPSKIYGVLAAARPVIFVGPEDCETARIVRASGAGRVVAPGDVAGLAGALAELAGDKALRVALGSLGRDYYESHLGLARSVGRMVALVTGREPEEDWAGALACDERLGREWERAGTVRSREAGERSVNKMSTIKQEL